MELAQGGIRWTNLIPVGGRPCGGVRQWLGNPVDAVGAEPPQVGIGLWDRQIRRVDAHAGASAGEEVMGEKTRTVGHPDRVDARVSASPRACRKAASTARCVFSKPGRLVSTTS